MTATTKPFKRRSSKLRQTRRAAQAVVRVVLRQAAIAEAVTEEAVARQVLAAEADAEAEAVRDCGFGIAD